MRGAGSVRVSRRMSTYQFEPIGYVRSPYRERADAPRQATVGADTEGQIDLIEGRGYEHALEGLEGWERLWVVFVFHRNVVDGRGWRPKVLPPRSERKQGVFATRSPHRPNPIGLSCVGLERIDGHHVHVRGLDLLDGTPVLDIKPYVAYADSHPNARAGWLAPQDPVQPWDIEFTPLAREQLRWLEEQGLELTASIASVLALGPAPHPYRRIRVYDKRSTLALKDWRVDFTVSDRRICVVGLRSGYRAQQLVAEPGLALHRSFSARWSSESAEG